MSARKYRKTLISSKGAYTKKSQKRNRKRKSTTMNNQELAMDIAIAENVAIAPTPWMDAAFTAYIPSSTKVNLRYGQPIAINNTLGSMGHWVFRANGMFDPDFSGSGHQPRGYDQLMQMYEHYQVIGAKITVIGRSNVTDFVTVLTLQNTSTVTASVADYLEARPQHTVIAPSDDLSVKCSLKFSQKDFFGSGQLDPDYKGTVSTNPGQDCYFVVAQTTMDPTSQVEFKGFAIIDYIAVFTEAKKPPMS